ncbi:hypothetical protein PGT21_020997 [Puccinia graminis f. sp. tritici]|uniref:Uncharacterized protein n=1 Tax=Puccinia graminis f. sp. tritici TaxID=56615 RepID=A0A5B0LNX4_PUCGR|nr:hypothetical protein PGTUg99_001755 [Puccinia graminis f. sp. tritici]KAA1071839.1 hypothetical protein PGT21_020997 [Puccinia graminis f. sp. tritici]
MDSEVLGVPCNEFRKFNTRKLRLLWAVIGTNNSGSSSGLAAILNHQALALTVFQTFPRTYPKKRSYPVTDHPGLIFYIKTDTACFPELGLNRIRSPSKHICPGNLNSGSQSLIQ